MIPEPIVCPWCDDPDPIRVAFMDHWDAVENGRWLLQYRCPKLPCRDNDYEGWFAVAVRPLDASEQTATVSTT